MLAKNVLVNRAGNSGVECRLEMFPIWANVQWQFDDEIKPSVNYW